MNYNMTAIILAGGKSTRMKGQDKAFIRINNQFLINRQLRLLKRDFKKIIIVTNSPQKYKSLKGVRVITDFVPHQGPLGGIYSGLLSSETFYNFVVACDMPFINEALIKYMLKNSDNYDAVIPRVDGQNHPLFGVYSKKCLAVIKKLLPENKLRVSDIFPQLKMRFILRREIERFDRRLLSIVNINSKKDLLALERHTKR